MRLQHVLAQLYSQPWLLSPETHALIVKVVEAHAGDTDGAIREGEGACGQAVTLDQMEVIDGIAYIPVGGVLGNHLTGFERGSGAVDLAWIHEELDLAEADEEVKSILLDIDSPGGMHAGIPELADRIMQVEKPIRSFTESMAASGAYWLASATDDFFVTDSSQVGSVGTYIPWVDQSKRFEAMGLKVEPITSGKYKAMGYPGTSLTEDHRALLQSRVDEITADFKSYVRLNFPDARDEDMQGQLVSGRHAASNGMASAVVSGRQELLELIS